MAKDTAEVNPAKGIPWAYALMMVAAGLTIGAIAGLSNTSISNTLIELIATFATGSAGLYFISRETLMEERKALSIIGGVGIAFFLAFWMAYVPTARYRYSGEAYYTWDDGRSFGENVALAELYGHAQALGIFSESVKKELEKIPHTPDKRVACRLLTDDPVEVTNVLDKVFSALAGKPPITESSGLAIKYLAIRFTDLNGALKADDSQKRNAAAKRVAPAIATLLTVARDEPDIGIPSRQLCPSSDMCALASRVADDIGACAGTTTEYLLIVRAHAQAYESVWKRPIATAPEKAVGTLEGLGVKPPK